MDYVWCGRTPWPSMRGMTQTSKLNRAGRVVRAVGVSLAFTLCVAGLSGCGAAGRSAGSSETALASTSLGAQMVDYFFPATGAQGANGALFFARLNLLDFSLFSGCMQSHGWNVQAPAASSSNIALEAGAGGGAYTSVGFPDMAWIARHRTFDWQPQLKGGNRAFDDVFVTGRTASLPKAEVRDSSKCASSAANGRNPTLQRAVCLAKSVGRDPLEGRELQSGGGGGPRLHPLR